MLLTITVMCYYITIGFTNLKRVVFFFSTCYLSIHLRDTADCQVVLFLTTYEEVTVLSVSLICAHVGRSNPV